jgi:hypothetical protein
MTRRATDREPAGSPPGTVLGVSPVLILAGYGACACLAAAATLRRDWRYAAAVPALFAAVILVQFAGSPA